MKDACISQEESDTGPKKISPDAAETSMPQPQDRLDSGVGTIDLEKTVHEIVQRSNLKASLQPEVVRRAMSTYLEPESSAPKPWETWL